MVLSSYMCGLRAFFLSLSFTLVMATLAFVAAGSDDIRIASDSYNSMSVATYADSSGIAAPGTAPAPVKDLNTSINPTIVVQPFEHHLLGYSNIPSPLVFLSYWQQFGISLPPLDRQALTIFRPLYQLEPLFVIAFEFLPEIRARKYFLTLITPANTLPWYLTLTSSNKRNRLGGWKDGNKLYSGSILYLS